MIVANANAGSNVPTSNVAVCVWEDAETYLKIDAHELHILFSFFHLVQSG